MFIMIIIIPMINIPMIGLEVHWVWSPGDDLKWLHWVLGQHWPYLKKSMEKVIKKARTKSSHKPQLPKGSKSS